MKKIYVIDAVRTPIGKYGGGLSAVRPDDLLAQVLRGLLRRNPAVPAGEIEAVVAGDANQAGEDCRNVARMSALLAGLPVSVPGHTVNSLCASGLQAIMDAARGIACGDGDIYLAAGVESMSRAPLVTAKKGVSWQAETPVFDSTIGWRFTNPAIAQQYGAEPMGETAERVAKQWKISRGEQDAYALESHQKYFKALQQGYWNDEIMPVQTPDLEGGKGVFADDEMPRRISLETLAGIRPAFERGGSVTAGNSSGLGDGAAGMLLASGAAVKRFGLRPMASIVATAVAGVEPGLMGTGPVPASLKALQRAGIAAEQVGRLELNEAFAATVLACRKMLGIDASRINVHGGSLAMGHPLGCTGARISATLLYELRRSGERYGMAALCAGLGQGAAIIYERVG